MKRLARIEHRAPGIAKAIPGFHGFIAARVAPTIPDSRFPIPGLYP